MAPGIYRTRTGYRAIACIGRGPGKRQEKAFPAGTAERAMVRWQRDTEVELRKALQARPAGSLLHDLEEAYLPAILGMPTRLERERHVRMWAAALGPTRTRDTVTPAEIRAVLERWRLEGWSPATCNRARTALMHVYTVLNGKSGANPVRDVAKYRERQRPPKPIDYPTFERILAAMPDTGRAERGGDRPAVSHTKARLRVLAYTGLPHAQIGQITPAHFRPDERLLYVPGRDKGQGTHDVWLPLSAAGCTAVAQLIAAGALGPFSASAMHTSFTKAARKAGRPDLSPYDLRHLFGTTVLRASANRAATRDLLLHTSDRTTARYTRAAISAELRHALALFDAEVVGTGCGAPDSEAAETAASDSSIDTSRP